MLENILTQLKSEVSGDLQQKADVDHDEVNGIMEVVKSVAAKKVGGELLSGGIDKVMNLFSDKSNSTEADSLQTSLSTGILNGLVEKMGFSKEKSATIVQIVVPQLIKLITNKNSQTPADDPSPLKNIFGGKGGNISGSKIGGLFSK